MTKLIALLFVAFVATGCAVQPYQQRVVYVQVPAGTTIPQEPQVVYVPPPVYQYYPPPMMYYPAPFSFGFVYRGGGGWHGGGHRHRH